MAKILEQASAGSAYETGAIYKKAIDKLVAENFNNKAMEGIAENTGELSNDALDVNDGTITEETNVATGEKVDPSTMIDPNQLTT